MKVGPVNLFVVGKVGGLQESGDVPHCLLPGLCNLKSVFSVGLNGTLERTDYYLSGLVGVAEGFKKYPV